MSIKENLLENHTYLLRYLSSHGSLSSVTILIVTEKAYNIRWNNGLNCTDTWELISKINSEYELIEDITNKVNKKGNMEFHLPLVDKEIIERIDKISKYFNNPKRCLNCNGEGYVPDDTNTSGKKLCPQCFGNKTIL